MSQYRPPTHTNPRFLDLIWQYKYYLVFYVVTISFLSFTALYLLGGVPNELKIVDEPLPTNPTATSTVKAGSKTAVEYPIRIIIDKIGINTSVSNPATADLPLLNNELLKGAVRYPGSGTLGKGNMFIFGHSSGIRVVNNQAYKAFNNLKELRIGDVIQVQSAENQYNYKVTSVKLVDSSEALVTFSDDKNMLTLSTCNVFGQKQERYVVEAIYIKSVALY
jgi:LPXTG-site transpeptidase (sortase) family protein